jgi:hypothetical protein
MDSNFAINTDASNVEAQAIHKNPCCYICNKPNHLAPDCPNEKREQSTQPLGPPGPSQRNNSAFLPCSITYNFDRTPYVRPLQPDLPRQAQSNRITPPNHKETASPKPKAVEACMINPDLFANDKDKCYTFEQEALSIKPLLARFNLRSPLTKMDRRQYGTWAPWTTSPVTGKY